MFRVRIIDGEAARVKREHARSGAPDERLDATARSSAPRFSVYYQNTPELGFFVSNEGGALNFVDDNTVLASFTPVPGLDLAAGPSFDIVGVAGLNPASGLHGRIALDIGAIGNHGWHGGGFTVGLDVHSSFLLGTALLNPTLGFGGG